MSSSEIIKEVLEKKFKKSLFSGYDPLDVDLFFDKVTTYINDLNEINKNIEDKYDLLNKKYHDLFVENEKLKNKILNYQKEIYTKNYLNKNTNKSQEIHESVYENLKVKNNN